MIGVVIPYFQRTPGLLNRTLRSVAAQAGSYRLRVYVVDDASPAPAEAELNGLPASFVKDIVILHQANAGPGAARNLALEEATEDVTAIAFLDSDDTWTGDHLAHACAALAAGADFYFADHRREEEAQSRFAQCAYQPRGAAIVGADDSVFWCEAGGLFRDVVLRSPVGTSTVVVRRAAIGATRFPPRFRAAGEDSIFWLELLSGDLRTACGVTQEAAYGRGVSIFNHKSWGDAQSLRTTLDQMRAHQHIRSNFTLDRELTGHCDAQLRELDLTFCANLMANARRLRWDAARPALAYLRRRPWAFARLPSALFGAVGDRRKSAGAEA